MISRLKWRWLDYLLVIAVFLILLFVFAPHSGLADFVRGALNLIATALIWGGNALKAIGR
jgi:hypothetical protein